MSRGDIMFFCFERTERQFLCYIVQSKCLAPISCCFEHCCVNVHSLKHNFLCYMFELLLYCGPRVWVEWYYSRSLIPFHIMIGFQSLYSVSYPETSKLLLACLCTLLLMNKAIYSFAITQIFFAITLL
jgi:hypothetical protein